MHSILIQTNEASVPQLESPDSETTVQQQLLNEQSNGSLLNQSAFSQTASGVKTVYLHI